MNNPIPVFEEIQNILSPVFFKEVDSATVYPKVQKKLAELRDWGVSEALVGLIDDNTQVILHMKEGDECAAAAYVMSEIEIWKKENPIWLKPNER